MAQAFVGLDLGTTGIKAVAFDADDRELAAAVLPTPTHRLSTGGAEYDANEMWSVTARVLRSVVTDLEKNGDVPVAVAAASMGESGVLVDDDGRPLAPVIAWFDTRTTPQAEWWAAHIGVRETAALTGLLPRPVYGATKMMWTKQHDPEAWSAGRWWLNMADWAAYRLCGTMATDHSLASRTLLLDVALRRWSDELLDASGLDASRLAPLVESGQRLGTVTEQAAAQTGLPVGTIVGAGGQDHPCAALGLSVTEPGIVIDSMGTAEAFFLVMPGFDSTGRLSDARISQGAHVESGRTYAMTGLQSGAGRIDAARRELGLEWSDFLQTLEAERVIDAVATEGQARLAEVLAVTGVSVTAHVATGGGTRNLRLMERKRELSPRPIEIASVTEATALGAARLARRATF